MKKLSIKELIEFRRKSDRAKKTFIENIKSNKIETPMEGGGNYWITSLSAICNSYKSNDLGLIDEKIDELQAKLSNTKYPITRTMYQRNIAALQKYKSMDIKKVRPSEKLSFLKKSTSNPLLTIKGLQIEARPSHIYAYGRKGEEKIGAVWFTAKINGYQIEEVGMFCDMLYTFLKQNYSKKYELIPNYCIAIDILSGHITDYSLIQRDYIPPLLTSTINEINKLM